MTVNNLNNLVHFIGWRSDIRDLYQQSDIYISTSYSESFPDAVREAMLFGKPVVVTNVGGTSELVKVGVSGFLFEPGIFIFRIFFIKFKFLEDYFDVF